MARMVLIAALMLNSSHKSSITGIIFLWVPLQSLSYPSELVLTNVPITAAFSSRHILAMLKPKPESQPVIMTTSLSPRAGGEVRC
uniref:Putative secreted protein n=1 Tax=Anopheles darlingi TaxID=43151 RepID=A0A2M4DJR8_ANODA